MKKQIFAIIMIFLSNTIFLFASSEVLFDCEDVTDEIVLIEPRAKKILASESQAYVRIECNVKNARVFINGNYQGIAPLDVKKLHPGQYKLELQKKGYENQIGFIEVKSKLELNYYITMEKEKNIEDTDKIETVSEIQKEE